MRCYRRSERNRINTKQILLLTLDFLYSDMRCYHGSENVGGAPQYEIFFKCDRFQGNPLHLLFIVL